MVWADMESGTLPADQRQTVRQGQQSETVVIQHLITKGTIDERILKALTQKEQTQTALMTAVRAEIVREENA